MTIEMKIEPQRRALLKAGAAILGSAVLPAAAAQAQGSSGGKPPYEFVVKDIVYQTNGGKNRLARLYQPAGSGPFPAVLQVHGGAWNNKDRTDGQNTRRSILPPPASSCCRSIFATRPRRPILRRCRTSTTASAGSKPIAGDFGSSAGQVGAYGTSSGGHQIMLAAIRPDDPRYRALPLLEAPDMDAKLAFVVSGWGVLFPLERYKLAKAKGDDKLAHGHELFRQ